jgi:hypothetical protein
VCQEACHDGNYAVAIEKLASEHREKCGRHPGHRKNCLWQRKSAMATKCQGHGDLAKLVKALVDAYMPPYHDAA